MSLYCSLDNHVLQDPVALRCGSVSCSNCVERHRSGCASCSKSISQLCSKSYPLTDAFNHLQSLLDSLSCSICSDLLSNPSTLDCGHTYCLKCINGWKQKGNCCPTCREVITGKQESSPLDSVFLSLLEVVELVKSKQSVIDSFQEANDVLSDDAIACLDSGNINYDPIRALSKFTELAQRCSPCSPLLPKIYYNIAWIHRCALDDPDLTTAFKYYLKAAELGDSWAANAVGYSFSHGLGCQVSHQRAVHWYRASAEMGVSWGANSLGCCLESGNGCVVNLEQAKRWLKFSSDQNNPLGMANYGRYLLRYGDVNEGRRLIQLAEDRLGHGKHCVRSIKNRHAVEGYVYSTNLQPN
ncbi:hypothetical protein RCL1_006650 [Eukaryota sp. TZLM3-RCL]